MRWSPPTNGATVSICSLSGTSIGSAQPGCPNGARWTSFAPRSWSGPTRSAAAGAAGLAGAHHAWFVHHAAMDHRQRDRARKRDGGVSGWAGQPAAVYCRISKARDEDQTGVDRQERLCREVAERLGLVIVPGCVFVDNNRSAWQRSRTRPGWDALLGVVRAGRVRHVIVYHPDRLMRQPRDLEELPTLSDEHDITLHGRRTDVISRIRMTGSSCGSRSRTPAGPPMTPRGGCATRWRTGPGRAVRTPARGVPTATPPAGWSSSRRRRRWCGRSSPGISTGTARPRSQQS